MFFPPTVTAPAPTLLPSARQALDRLPPLPSGFECWTLACAHCPGSEGVDLGSEPAQPRWWQPPAPPGWGAMRLAERIVAWVDAHAACEARPAVAGWRDEKDA